LLQKDDDLASFAPARLSLHITVSPRTVFDTKHVFFPESEIDQLKKERDQLLKERDQCVLEKQNLIEACVGK